MCAFYCILPLFYKYEQKNNSVNTTDKKYWLTVTETETGTFILKENSDSDTT